MVRRSRDLLALSVLGVLRSGCLLAQAPLDPSLRAIGEMSTYRTVCGWFNETLVSDEDADRAARLLAKSAGIDVDTRQTRTLLRQWNRTIRSEYAGRLAGDQFRWCSSLAKKIASMAQKDS